MSVYAMSIALVGWKVYCPNMAKYTRRIINDPLKWAVGQRELDDKHFSPSSLSSSHYCPCNSRGWNIIGKGWPYPSWFPNEYGNQNEHTSDYLHIHVLISLSPHWCLLQSPLQCIHFIDASSSSMPPPHWCLILINAYSSLIPLLYQ